MAAQLAFIIVFEHAVFGLKFITMWLIPDVPKRVSVVQQQEKYIGAMALQSAVFQNQLAARRDVDDTEAYFRKWDVEKV